MSLEIALAKVPSKFRARIIQHFTEVKSRLVEGKDDTVGLAAGKFCETILRFLQHEILGKHTPFNKAIGSFGDDCRKLITAASTTVPDSLRVVMPRALVFVYTVRNKRNVGHVGGDVDANHIDAMTIARVCDWILCEIIRVYHNLSLEEAQDLVDGLSLRVIPDIWQVAGTRRVLRSDLSTKQKVLLLCYQEPNSSILSEDLCAWVDYSSISMFKTRVLVPLHLDDLIHYDMESESVTISPLGITDVETDILKTQIA